MNVLIIYKLMKIRQKKQKVKEWIKAFIPKRMKEEQSEEGYEVQQFEKHNYEKEEWTQAQAEIINQLINMYNLMKITKHIDLEEYLALKQINDILCQEIVDKVQTKKCLLGGLSIQNKQTQKKSLTKQLPYQYYSVRALLWEINLGFLPEKHKNKWVSTMEAHLKKYNEWIRQYLVQPIQRKKGLSFQKKESFEEKKKDHPLNFSSESKWKNYFEDVELWKTIQKDIIRTRSTCKFYQEPFQYEFQGTTLQPQQLTFTQISRTYADSLTRILFIYLKNHPEEIYCQGMNELIALVYYCLTNKNSEYFRRVSQSNSYVLFEIMMRKLPKKHFERGPQYVDKFVEMLKKMDLRLYEEIQKKQGIHHMKVITMKWFLTGFLTEYPIDECLLLWDGVISYDGNYISDYFYYISLAIIHLCREKIIEDGNILLVLNQINSLKVQEIIEKTNNLYRLFPKIL